MNHHSSDFQKNAKLQRPGNRVKASQKVDQHKIDEILGQDLPGTPPHVLPNADLENQQPSRPGQYGSIQGISALPGTNKSNKNQKLPVLPPLAQSKKQDIHSNQKPSHQLYRQNISNDLNVPNKRRSSNGSNQNVKINNNPRPTFELPKLPKKVDKFAMSADLSDLEDSESCSSVNEEFKKSIPNRMSKSNSIDNFNMTSTIIDDFFQSSDDSEYESDDESISKSRKSNNKDQDGDSSDEFSFDEIISDSDNEFNKTEKKQKNFHLLTSQELQLCKDASTLHNTVKQRIDKLLKVARNHFPATKDNTAMLTRLVEQSRACHEFHFLEKRTKYYESENRGLTIALTSLEDILSNPQSASANSNINNKVKFGLQRLNALQMRQAKRMSKELTQAQRKIKKLRAEISKLHTEMRASVKARRGGDGSLLIAEMSNNNSNNNGNVANFGGGNGVEDEELAALRVEHQFSIAKEKAAVGVMQNENEELERVINTYEKRIVLMTQKESNYSRLFKKKPTNSNEKSPPKVSSNSNDKSPPKIFHNEKSPPKVSSNVKSSLKVKASQKTENKKETSPNQKRLNEKEKSGNPSKNPKNQKNDHKIKQQNQNEDQKMQHPTKESPTKKPTAASPSSSSNNATKASPRKKKKEDDDEVPIIEVLSI